MFGFKKSCVFQPLWDNYLRDEITAWPSGTKTTAETNSPTSAVETMTVGHPPCTAVILSEAKDLLRFFTAFRMTL
jgi:hypothetical protein